MRGQGRIFHPTWTDANGVRHVAKTWRLDYSINGTRHLENAHTTSQREALNLLRQRVGDRRNGKLVGSPDRVTFGDLRTLVERQYVLDGLRSTERLADAFDHLQAFFGETTRANEITTDRVDAYAEQRLAVAAAATVNYEKAMLRRAFNLAREKGILGSMPVIKTPKVRNARQGFFSEGDFAALLLELKDPLLVHYVRLKRITGWRDNELRPLLWTYVDREAKEIRIPAAETKGDKALRFRYGLVPDAVALIDALWKSRNGLYVFQRGGKPLKDYRGAWKAACKRAGLIRTVRDPETHELREELPRPHDFRRTAARDYRPYMSEQEIMDLCGWSSRETFARYNITTPEDVDAGLARRFNGQVPSKSETPERETDHVS